MVDEPVIDEGGEAPRKIHNPGGMSRRTEATGVFVEDSTGAAR